jgi:TRAP-type C4-dicarboxylate transport system permease small subunit
MNGIHALIDRITEKIGNALSFLILPLMAIVVYSVIMRYVFKNALTWSFEVSLFLFGMYGMLGGGYCVLTKTHVNVDILPRKLPETGQLILNIVSSLIILVVVIVMLIFGIQVAYQSTLILERSVHQTAFNPQIWWFRWTIPLAALLVMIKTVSDLIISFKELLGKRMKK